MKSRDKARHDAKMAAMRKAGKTSTSEPATIPGGFTRFLPERDSAVLTDHLLTVMRNFRLPGSGAVVRELGLRDPETLVVLPERVKTLRVEDVAKTEAVQSFVHEDLADVLLDRLDRRVRKGWLKPEARDAELRRFHEETAPHAAAVFAGVLIDQLRSEVGL